MYTDDRPPLLKDKRILLGGGGILLTIAVIVGGLSGAISPPWLTGNEDSEPPPRKMLLPEVRYETRYADIELVLRALPVIQRRALVQDQAAFTGFVAKEIARRALVAGARESGLQNKAQVAFLMQRGADDVLAQQYVARHAQDNLPRGFPSDQLIRAFYARHQADFAIEPRVHVYQIFFPLPSGNPEDYVKALKDKAISVSRRINKGQLDFARAAAEYSAHAASAINGGYAGLLKESELRPEARAALLALPEGRVSKPYLLKDGVHLFMRGHKVAAQPVSLQQAAAEIKKLLIKQFHNEQRQQMVAGIGREHVVAISDTRLEQWREKLQSVSGWSSVTVE